MMLYRMLASKYRVELLDQGFLRDGEEDGGTTAQSSHQIAHTRDQSNDRTTEGSSCRNDTFELPVHRLFSMTSHNQALFLQLLGHIPRARSADFNPGFAEERTS